VMSWWNPEVGVSGSGIMLSVSPENVVVGSDACFASSQL
jgi:hypothetical protein